MLQCTTFHMITHLLRKLGCKGEGIEILQDNVQIYTLIYPSHSVIFYTITKHMFIYNRNIALNKIQNQEMQGNITLLCTLTMHILSLIFRILWTVLNVGYCSFSVSSAFLYPDSSITNMTDTQKYFIDYFLTHVVKNPLQVPVSEQSCVHNWFIMAQL